MCLNEGEGAQSIRYSLLLVQFDSACDVCLCIASFTSHPAAPLHSSHSSSLPPFTSSQVSSPAASIITASGSYGETSPGGLSWPKSCISTSPSSLGLADSSHSSSVLSFSSLMAAACSCSFFSAFLRNSLSSSGISASKSTANSSRKVRLVCRVWSKSSSYPAGHKRRLTAQRSSAAY